MSLIKAEHRPPPLIRPGTGNHGDIVSRQKPDRCGEGRTPALGVGGIGHDDGRSRGGMAASQLFDEALISASAGIPRSLPGTHWRKNNLICATQLGSTRGPVAAQVRRLLRAQLVFQLDPSTPARPSRVA